ncbi:hypothetical protein POM88_004016 [Heracleum sosnowskyi]|uniref:Uncharacterized protein n=1 Tax=Heracleum sosnowskyi TaxID=360622 RepID=A0AAD8JKQ5_9APIA|nr:hypothetical protein POM88_004016 [Heracleum sosnowskyi]
MSVHSHICISFTHQTTVEHVIHNDQMIPFHHFDIEYIGNLRNILGAYYDPTKSQYSIDVMGFMDDLQPPRIIGTKYGPKAVVKFSINDGTKTAEVTICPETVPYVISLFQNGLQQPVVVILASVKICCDKRSTGISSLPTTRIYANLNDESVHRFRQGFDDHGCEN